MDNTNTTHLTNEWLTRLSDSGLSWEQRTSAANFLIGGLLNILSSGSEAQYDRAIRCMERAIEAEQKGP